MLARAPVIGNSKPAKPGDTVSHYRIVEELGGGGMGVVYKAADLRLHRFVALKFLPPTMTGNDEANARFRQEAQAASALDHPNICTIHEIDETSDGRLFLALAFYDGKTLKHRIAAGPMPVADALEIAIQTARGLASAHHSGIVHRDIKPANLMLTVEGLVKIVDFGIAKLTGDVERTRTGTTLGTVAYMSPEQTRGEGVEPATDTWALGVVLYEMLAGERPFTGNDEVAVLTSILQDEPKPLPSGPAGVPPELQRVVGRALEKHRSSRYHSAAEMLADLVACRDTLAARATRRVDLLQQLRRPAVLIPAIALLTFAVATGSWAFRRGARAQWVRDEAVPEIMRLIDREQFSEAFELAQQAEDTGDPVLARLWPQFALPVTIATDPDGAAVYVREYTAGESGWKHLGQTPIKDVKLPRGVFQFRIEKAGYDTLNVAARNPSSLLGTTGDRMIATKLLLSPAESRPGMVPITGGSFPVALSGFTIDQPRELEPFLIDRYEVTNKQYKVFVDSGAYQNEQLWLELLSAGDQDASWRKQVATFRDATDRPGPATWELGRYVAGQDEYPVAGISWYEAVAYCRAQGKELPTLFHFARAALAPDEIDAPLASAIIPLSNFGTSGPAPVGTFRGMGPFGTFDMGGNVKEWIWNEASERRRWVLGGAWSDPEWMLLNRDSAPPLTRLSTIGFRCAVSAVPGPFSPQAQAKVDTVGRDLSQLRSVSNEVFEVFRRQLAYAPAPLDQRVESVKTDRPDWITESVSTAAGYESGRVTTRLFLPRTGKPPYHAVVYFPGLGSFSGRGSSENLQPPGEVDFIVSSGRALVWTGYKGSYERWDPFLNLEGDENSRVMRTRMFEWRQDLGRTIDLLSSRQDIDANRVAYLGISFGASVPLPLLALESRLKTAVLLAPGFSFRALPPEADGVNYASRITMPVLMVGGRHDYVLPYEMTQRPLFEQLGTPADQKRHVVFEAGHMNFPRAELIREVLAWLDRYLGPVDSAPKQ